MALTIFCDESGYSGGSLFLEEQRYYVYASIAIENDEAIEVVKKIRTDSKTQADELKFEKLKKSPRGRAAVQWFLKEHPQKIAIFYAEKNYSTAAKFFEYTFEPVLRPKKMLFYDIEFHRFVSTLLFDAWLDGEAVAKEFLEDGQNLIRFNRPEELTRLLREPLHRSDGDDPLTAIAAFCHTYRDDILAEVESIQATPELKRWTMDVSGTALLETFHRWGDDGTEIEVYCDESKPLADSAMHMRKMATERLTGVMREHFGDRKLVRMPKPVTFLDSNGAMVAIQLADITAGAARFALADPENPDAAAFEPLLEPLYIRNCIYPQNRNVDIDRPEVELNVAVLYELGRRARKRLDPLDKMERHIAIAKAHIFGRK